MQNIFNILTISPETYEEIKIGFWMKWCSEKTNTMTDFYAFVINEPLRIWWNIEYEKLEQRFLQDCKPYFNETLSDELLEIYRNYVQEIEKVYSKVLMKTAKMTFKL